MPDPTPRYPDSLSPSRANDFLTCPLLFRLRSIDRLPEAPSPAAIRGTVVHSALERLFDAPPEERTLESAQSLYLVARTQLIESDEESAAVLLADDADDPLAKVSPLLRNYFTLENPQHLEPHARETPVSAELAPNFVARGFVDRVDRSGDGRIRIVDYKTGRSPGPGFEGKSMFQMRFYALVWWRMTGVVPTMLRLVFLGDSQLVAYSPNEDDLESTERKVLAIRDAISRAVHEGFTPRKSKLCSWCAFQALCPAFGGTPPPMPEPPIGLGPAGSPPDLVTRR